MDLFVKGLKENLKQVKTQATPDEYYKLLEKIMMVCNVEYQDRPPMLENCDKEGE